MFIIALRFGNGFLFLSLTIRCNRVHWSRSWHSRHWESRRLRPGAAALNVWEELVPLRRKVDGAEQTETLHVLNEIAWSEAVHAWVLQTSQL